MYSVSLGRRNDFQVARVTKVGGVFFTKVRGILRQKSEARYFLGKFGTSAPHSFDALVSEL